MSNMILCPTRGGKDDYPNQDRAVALAKERGVEVLFLYISNVEFLGLTAAPKLIDIEHELDEMGEFMLTMAQERAEKAGVDASTLVKHGHFLEALAEVIGEYEISTVILGTQPVEQVLFRQIIFRSWLTRLAEKRALNLSWLTREKLSAHSNHD